MSAEGGAESGFGVLHTNDHDTYMIPSGRPGLQPCSKAHAPEASPEAVVLDFFISPSLKSRSCLMLDSSPGEGMCWNRLRFCTKRRNRVSPECLSKCQPKSGPNVKFLVVKYTMRINRGREHWMGGRVMRVLRVDFISGRKQPWRRGIEWHASNTFVSCRANERPALEQTQAGGNKKESLQNLELTTGTTSFDTTQHKPKYRKRLRHF